MLVPLYLPLWLHSYPPVSLYLAYLAPYYRITQVTPRLYTSTPPPPSAYKLSREKLTKCGHFIDFFNTIPVSKYPLHLMWVILPSIDFNIQRYLLLLGD